MKRIFLALLIIFAGFVSSCEKDYGVFNSDNRPEVPVTFPGATTHGFNPYITYSMSSGRDIEITMSIPESSGRTIKEITKVAAGLSGINAGSLNASTFITSPIQANGTQAKFTTTWADFKSKTKLVEAPGKDLVPGGEIAFMFLITLDDGTTIVPVQFRVRLTA